MKGLLKMLAIVAVVSIAAAVFVVFKIEVPRENALTECNTLGGTLIISADERYICVPDAVEVGE